MTQAINNKLRLTGIAGTLALAMTLSTASASFAGERGDRWERDGSSRIERHYDRDRRAERRVRRADRRAERRVRRADRRAERRVRRAERRVRRADRRAERRAYRYNSHRGHRHGYRHGRHYGHRHGDSLVPVVAGIGLGLLTYAIIDSHRSY